MSTDSVVVSDTRMNMTSQQLVALTKVCGVAALHLALSVKMSSWITLAFDRAELQRLAPGSSGLREKLALGLAQSLRRQIEEMSDADVNLLFDQVELKEVRDDSDRVLLDEGAIETNAVALCAANGIEIVEIDGVVCRYRWRDDQSRFSPNDFETSSQAAINAIEVRGLDAEHVGLEAGLRALELCKSRGIEIFPLVGDGAKKPKFGWRSAEEGENGVFGSQAEAAFGAIEELGLEEPVREVPRG